MDVQESAAGRLVDAAAFEAIVLLQAFLDWLARSRHKACKRTMASKAAHPPIYPRGFLNIHADFTVHPTTATGSAGSTSWSISIKTGKKNGAASWSFG